MASFSKFKQQLEQAVKRVTKVDAWPATVVRAGTAPARSVVKFTNGLELEVLNYRFSSVADLKVNVGYDPLLPGVLQVLGIRESINLIGQASSWSFWLPEHHANHEFPNPDTVWVHGAQFVPLNVTVVSGLTVRIFGSVLWGDGTWVGFQTDTQDMTSHVPAAGARFVLLEIETDGTVVLTDGSVVDTRFVLTYADIPDPTEGRKPICAIRLYDGQTTIYHDVRVGKPNDVIDLRWSGFPATHNHDTRYPRKYTGKTAAPTADDDSGDGYAVGDRWIDETNDKEYVALDVTVGAAVWTETTGAGGGGAAWSDIDSATADTPLDADKFGFWDVVDAALKSITWANIKATLKTYFDTLYAAAADAYSDEKAQDAVGAMIADTATIDLTYTDATPELKADVKDDSITNAKLAEVATSTIKGRVTAGTGNPEDLTVAQVKTLLAMQTGESVLGANFSITGTAGTYQDTGLSITLPAAGTYLISANVRAALTGNAGTLWWINIKLYNSTDAADVSNSERMCALTAVTAVNMQNTAPIQTIVTVAASKTIKLYAARNGSGSPSWTQSLIGSDANGRTTLGYVEITK